MKKKYTTPEIEIVKFESKDVIQTSGIVEPENLPKTLTGAEQLNSVQYTSIFD